MMSATSRTRFSSRRLSSDGSSSVGFWNSWKYVVWSAAYDRVKFSLVVTRSIIEENTRYLFASHPSVSFDKVCELSVLLAE